MAADAAANVKYKEPFIILDKSDMVLELALGAPGPGTDVNFVGHNEAQRMTATRGSGFKAYKGGGGKEWQINGDGSISKRNVQSPANCVILPSFVIRFSVKRRFVMYLHRGISYLKPRHVERSAVTATFATLHLLT